MWSSSLHDACISTGWLVIICQILTVLNLSIVAFPNRSGKRAWLAGVEQQHHSELASAVQQSETRLGEVEGEVLSKVKALSQLVDHTAKAGSQVMSHMAQLEATSRSDIAG